MIRRLLHILPLLLITVSCVYPYTVEGPEIEQEVPVFDGSIILGKEAKLLYSKMVPVNMDGGGYYLTATFPWWVEDETGARYLPDEETQTANLEAAPLDRKYRMVIQWNGDTFESDWLQAEEKPVIDAIDYTVAESSFIINLDIHTPEGCSPYVDVFFTETWEFHTEYIMDYGLGFDPEKGYFVYPLSGLSLQRYWCWKSAEGGHNFLDMRRMDGILRDYPLQVFNRSDERCHRKYSIEVTARTISEDEYTYQYNIKSGVGVGGQSLFTPDPGEIPGNICCTSDPGRKVLGYVTISNSASKRIMIDIQEYAMSPRNLTPLTIPENEEYPLYVNLGYKPVKDAYVDGVAGVGWAPERCIDCVVAGGTQTKPEWW